MKGPKSRCEHAATQSDRDGRVEAWIWLGIAVGFMWSGGV